MSPLYLDHHEVNSFYHMFPTHNTVSPRGQKLSKVIPSCGSKQCLLTLSRSLRYSSHRYTQSTNTQGLVSSMSKKLSLDFIALLREFPQPSKNSSISRQRRVPTYSPAHDQLLGLNAFPTVHVQLAQQSRPIQLEHALSSSQLTPIPHPKAQIPETLI